MSRLSPRENPLCIADPHGRPHQSPREKAQAGDSPSRKRMAALFPVRRFVSAFFLPGPQGHVRRLLRSSSLAARDPVYRLGCCRGDAAGKLLCAARTSPPPRRGRCSAAGGCGGKCGSASALTSSGVGRCTGACSSSSKISAGTVFIMPPCRFGGRVGPQHSERLVGKCPCIFSCLRNAADLRGI